MEKAESIECVNFEMGEESITFEELMNNPIFSPSGRFAVSLKLHRVNRIKLITSMYVLDVTKMTFHKYENKNEKHEIEMQVDIVYFYGENSLIVIAADYMKKKFMQTPIFIDNKTKTFEISPPASYSFSNFGTIHHLAKLVQFEASVVVIEGNEYVIWVGDEIVLESCMKQSYAIPREPYSKLRPKKFMLPLSWDQINPTRLASAEMQIKLKYYLNMEPLIHVVDNIAYFSISTWMGLSIGLYLTLDFSKMIDVFNVEVDGNSENEMRQLYNRQKEALKIIECQPSNFEKLEGCYFLRKFSKTMVCGGKFVTVGKTRSEMKIKKRTSLTYVDFATNNITVVNRIEADRERFVTNIGANPLASRAARKWKFVYLRNAQSVLLTPYNVLIASRSSAHRINCSVLPLPIGNKVLSLYEMALRKIYLRTKM